MSKFFDENGLVTSKPNLGHTEENSMLWSAELILLERIADIHTPESQARILGYKRAIEKCRIREGLFHQNPAYALKTPTNGDQYMSPDQLLAIVGMSTYFGWGFEREIWKEIKRQKLGYNNIDDKYRFIHPKHLIFYGMCAGSPLAYLFYPLFLLMCIFACLQPRQKTSGKLLCLVMSKCLKRKPLIGTLSYFIFTKCVKLTTKGIGWKDVFSIYFPDIEHPCNIVARKAF